MATASQGHAVPREPREPDPATRRDSPDESAAPATPPEMISVPIWYERLLVIIVSGVLSCGAIGLFLAMIGRHTAALTFILGVMPLAFASGPGSGAQNAISIGVLGGLTAATIFVVFYKICEHY